MKAARSLFVALILFAVAAPAFAFPRFHIRGVNVGAGYSHFSGPFYPGWGFAPWAWGPWGYYDPFWYGTMAYGYAPYGYLTPAADKGQVQLKGLDAAATVYINGAYAGTAKDLKKMWLEPGVYEIEARPPSGNALQKRVYVLSGKTLNLRLDEASR